MNGWILKALHPVVYGNHDWRYVSSYDVTNPSHYMSTFVIKRKMRNYKCTKCGQELSMHTDIPRTIEPAILWYDDCNEGAMNEALS